MKYYNEMEQSWRKLKQNRPEVAKAIEESDEREYLGHGGWKSASQTTPCDDLVYRAPIQTEAEKFLEKWKGKRIRLEYWEDHNYVIPNGLKNDDLFTFIDQDGDEDFHNYYCDWLLWEPPKPKGKLDTRRVAGWWVFFLGGLNYLMCSDVGRCGLSLKVSDTWVNIENLKCAVFSKDPSTPLDQWQTLEEICGGES